jgi:DNA-binding PadR family transcriptional regulator
MIYGISQKMLTTTLRSLERDGFVVRTVFPTTPPSVSYELTELGRDLLVPVGALAKWATANQARVDTAREKFDRVNGRLDRPPLEPARAAKGNGAAVSARHVEDDLAADVAGLT